jgi:hypothetical protein
MTMNTRLPKERQKLIERGRGHAKRVLDAPRLDPVFLLRNVYTMAAVEVKVYGGGDWQPGDLRGLIGAFRTAMVHGHRSLDKIVVEVVDSTGQRYDC